MQFFETRCISMSCNYTSCAVAVLAKTLWAPERRVGACYSATYMSETRDQQRFTISEVAADWHEPMVPQRII